MNEQQETGSGLLGLGPSLGDVKENWGWVLALGFLFIILGFVGFGMVAALTITTTMFFGGFLFAGGLIQLFHAFKCKGWKSILWHILIALLYIIVGAEIMYDPVHSSYILTMMIAVGLMMVGSMRIVMAFQIKGAKSWIWLLFAGIISLILGGIILAQWPFSSLWVIGLIVAVELTIHGWSYVMLALLARNAE